MIELALYSSVVLGAGACGLDCPHAPAPSADPDPARLDAAPLEAISHYLDGFHFESGDIDDQVEAHHYVTILDDDLMQALIFDGDGPDARLIGVEYIIGARRFATLPPEEKKLWHSHRYEVRSGLLIAPGLAAPVERALMTRLASTYGKTWHTWHEDDELPLGIPRLMMSFTGAGQIDAGLLADRDCRFGVDAAAIAEDRADLPVPEILDPLADSWTFGEVIELRRVTNPRY